MPQPAAAPAPDVTTSAEPPPVGQPVDIARLAAAAKEEPAAPDVEVKDLPLFSGQVFAENVPTNIAIYRLGPIPEGMLGTVEATTTEDDLRRRFGGGHYKLEARTARGYVIKGGSKQIQIAGEPIFQSDGCRAEYQQLVRNRFQQAPTFIPPAPTPAPAATSPAPAPAPAPVAAPAAPVATPPIDNGMAALLAALITAQSSAQAQMMTMMMDAADKREASQLRMFELMRQSAPATPPPQDAVTLLKEGMRLAARIGGGKDEEPSALTKIIDGAPKLMAAAADMAAKAEKKKGEASAQQPAPAQQPGPEIDRAALEEAIRQDLRQRTDVLMLEGGLGELGAKAVANLQTLGLNPEEVISQTLAGMAALTKEKVAELGMGPKEPEAPRAPAPAPAPQPVPVA